jgi:uncharacterized membrane protein YfcA
MMDLSTGEIVFASAVMLVAYIVKGASSFGPSLISVPLLTYIWPHPGTFLPSLALLNLGGNLTLIQKFWKHVHGPTVFWLSLGTAMGLPGGVYLLTVCSESTLQGIVAVAVLGAMPLVFLKPKRLAHSSPIAAVIAGIFSGALGGSIGIDGPPYVIYTSSRFRDDPKTQYATTVAAFTFGCTFRAISFGLAGFLTLDSWGLAAAGIPLLLLGLSLGIQVFKKLSKKGFDRVVGGLLVATSLSLLYRVFV